jgi:hypothetical protein
MNKELDDLDLEEVVAGGEKGDRNSPIRVWGRIFVAAFVTGFSELFNFWRR